MDLNRAMELQINAQKCAVNSSSTCLWASTALHRHYLFELLVSALCLSVAAPLGAQVAQPVAEAAVLGHWAHHAAPHHRHDGDRSSFGTGGVLDVNRHHHHPSLPEVWILVDPLGHTYLLKVAKLESYPNDLSLGT